MIRGETGGRQGKRTHLCSLQAGQLSSGDISRSFGVLGELEGRFFQSSASLMCLLRMQRKVEGRIGGNR
jgi:hypothetical protein